MAIQLGAPTKRSPPSFMITAVATIALFISLAALFKSDTSIANHLTSIIPDRAVDWSHHGSYQWDFARDEQRHGLTDEQCDIAFPKMFGEIDRVLTLRQNSGKNVTSEELDSMMDIWGMVRVVIYEGKLYIVKATDRDGPIYHERFTAVLQQLNRAISGAHNPKDIPNVEFVLGMGDTTHIEHGTLNQDRAIWTFSRSINDTNIWLTPEWGNWMEIGSPEEIRMKMLMVEDEIKAKAEEQDIDPFDLKYQRLLWRGSVWLNPGVRQALVDASEGKSWGDASNSMSGIADEHKIDMADQCRWQYLAYTEGISYSGRLKYFHNCRSVVVSHELAYTTPLMSLLEPEGDEQNVVMVRRDFTDLDEKMTFLIEHPEEARRIADNSVKTFRERYLTSAAEACYWRRLFRAWSQISFEPKLYEVNETTGKKKFRAVAFEAFTMPGRFQYEHDVSGQNGG